ncbi:MAG: 3-dehydroquinate synthase [Deinococcales bacterium]
MAIKQSVLRRLDVALTPSYPVLIAEGLLDNLASYISEKRIAIIKDTVVGPLYAARVKKALEGVGKESSLHLVQAGEDSKTLASFGALLAEMVGEGLERKSAILALGGGVIGDLAGFVAASYMRGINFYQFPTSLLAMVDASVGGKTGVNLAQGKNLVGAFWQPKAVFIDPSVLRTLSLKEFKQGAVELFKHGLLADGSILTDVLRDDFHPQGDPDFLADLILRSVKVKADIVAQDEREGNVRAFLNLGHTLAHALEAESNHHISHGEAVVYGLVFASKLAALRGFSDEGERVKTFWHYVKPAALPQRDFQQLLPYIARDKKHHSSKQNWVLLKTIGQPCIVSDVSLEHLELSWQEVLKLEEDSST